MDEDYEQARKVRERENNKRIWLAFVFYAIGAVILWSIWEGRDAMGSLGEAVMMLVLVGYGIGGLFGCMAIADKFLHWWGGEK